MYRPLVEKHNLRSVSKANHLRKLHNSRNVLLLNKQKSPSTHTENKFDKSDSSNGEDDGYVNYLGRFNMISNTVNWETKHTDIDELHPSTPSNKVTPKDWVKDKELKLKELKNKERPKVEAKKTTSPYKKYNDSVLKAPTRSIIDGKDSRSSYAENEKNAHTKKRPWSKTLENKSKSNQKSHSSLRS